MAGTPQYRPMTATWRGYFVSEHSANVGAVDEDSRAVAARVRHLRHLAAARAARTEAEQHHPTGVRAVDTALFEDIGLFDDDGRLRPRRRIADPGGGDLPIGESVDDLIGRYGRDSVGRTGQYGSGPGDPRDSWRIGMAKQDEPSSNATGQPSTSASDYDPESQPSIFDPAERAMNVLAHLDGRPARDQMAAGSGLRDMAKPSGYSIPLGWPLEGEVLEIEESAPLFAGFDEVGRLMEEQANAELDRIAQEADERIRAYRQRPREASTTEVSDEKPHPDDYRHQDKPHPDDVGKVMPTNIKNLGIQGTLSEISTWGTPATDYENGGRRFRLASARDLARARQAIAQLRVFHPFINWDP